MSTLLSRGLVRSGLSRGALLWLLLALFLTGTYADTPTAGLDPSWKTAMNTVGGLRFGPELLFTYGPWGFLDAPLIVDRRLYLLTLLAETAAAAAVWLVAHRALSRVSTPWVAGALSTCVAVVVATTEVSAMAFCAAAGAVLLRVVPADGRPEWSARSSLLFSSALGMLAALLLQVKISDGVAVAALALVSTLAAATMRDRLAGLLATVTTLVASTVALWLVRGQSLGDLPVWLRGSLELVSGYGEGLAFEVAPNVIGYLEAIAVGVLLVVVAAPVLRDLGWSTRIIVSVVVVLVVAFAFKAGFTRHDIGHEPDFFIITGVLLVALAGRSPRSRAALLGAVLVLGLAVPGLEVVDPVKARTRWQSNAEVFLNPTYVEERLAAARGAAQGVYAMPEPVLAGLAGVPVSIEPWEVTIAWTYNLDWSPVPVFQNYAAVTDDLDRRNAEAIVAAPADQRIVRREDTVPVDGHNPLWEVPQYQLAVACHYATVENEAGWRLLEHRAPRCGDPRVGSSTRVEAGGTVDVPEVADDEILTMSFQPDEEGVVARLVHLALKPYRFLMVSTADRTYRVSRELSPAGLIVAFPTVDDGALAPFAYDELTFNEPGEVTFSTVPMR